MLVSGHGYACSSCPARRKSTSSRPYPAVKCTPIGSVSALCSQRTDIAGTPATSASYKVPKVVRVVDALPKDTQGKILKRRLRDEYS